MAQAAPFAMKAGTGILGSLLGKKLSGPSQPQQAAQTGMTQNADQLTAQGSPLLQQGQQNLAGAGDYYRKILSGSRSTTQAALAPETNTVMDYYRGAQGKAQREMRGGVRDTAVAELDRQRVGNLAMQAPMARAGAAQGAGQVGTTQAGQGGNLLATAGYLRSGLFNNATTLQDQAAAGGRGWGSLLYDIASAGWPKKKPMPGYPATGIGTPAGT